MRMFFMPQQVSSNANSSSHHNLIPSFHSSKSPNIHSIIQHTIKIVPMLLLLGFSIKYFLCISVEQTFMNVHPFRRKSLTWNFIILSCIFLLISVRYIETVQISAKICVMYSPIFPLYNKTLTEILLILKRCKQLNKNMLSGGALIVSQ